MKYHYGTICSRPLSKEKQRAKKNLVPQEHEAVAGFFSFPLFSCAILFSDYGRKFLQPKMHFGSVFWIFGVQYYLALSAGDYHCTEMNGIGHLFCELSRWSLVIFTELQASDQAKWAVPRNDWCWMFWPPSIKTLQEYTKYPGDLIMDTNCTPRLEEYPWLDWSLNAEWLGG